ncbi:MAG: MBL fold metallo-hydrolase [Bacteroidota bacterium]
MCKPGQLGLVILTHGDHDHAGNSLFLREKYGARIAIHADDSLMVQNGDMNWNRKEKADRFSFRFRLMSVMSIFFNPGEFKTFTPDIYLDESFDLSEYHFDARIICTPGHSKGSVSVLTGDGRLICGDLLYNFFGRPRLEFCDDIGDFHESVNKLKNYDIKLIYPGHGKPFTWDAVLKKYN